MAGTSGFSVTLPILDDNNFGRWRNQIKAVLGYQDVLDMIEDGVQELEVGATAAEKLAYKEAKRKDYKALMILHQAVDTSNYEKIANATTSKEAWECLEKSFEGDAIIKKVKLQSLRREYEMMHMKEGESVSSYMNRIHTLTNQMKACGKEFKNRSLVEKVMRTVTNRFEHIVVTIEQTKDLDKYKLVELQGALQTHELRWKEKNGEQGEQALFSKFKNQKQWNKCTNRNKWKGSDSGSESSKCGTESKSQKEGDSFRKGFDNKRKIDKKRIQCFNCRNYGHFASECKFSKQWHKKKEEEAGLAQEDSDDELVLLMATTKQESMKVNIEYEKGQVLELQEQPTNLETHIPNYSENIANLNIQIDEIDNRGIITSSCSTKRMVCLRNIMFLLLSITAIAPIVIYIDQLSSFNSSSTNQEFSKEVDIKDERFSFDVGISVAYFSRKVLNLSIFVMNLETLECDLLCGILESEIRELDLFLETFFAEIVIEDNQSLNVSTTIEMQTIKEQSGLRLLEKSLASAMNMEKNLNDPKQIEIKKLVGDVIPHSNIHVINECDVPSDTYASFTHIKYMQVLDPAPNVLKCITRGLGAHLLPNAQVVAAEKAKKPTEHDVIIISFDDEDEEKDKQVDKGGRKEIERVDTARGNKSKTFISVLPARSKTIGRFTHKPKDLEEDLGIRVPNIRGFC